MTKNSKTTESEELAAGEVKVLSIQQPWASLIVAGLKDVENRTWATKYRGKLLIHASSKKVSKNFYETIPIEWVNEIDNAIIMGVIPELNELPTCAIVGYVDLTDCVTELTESVWDGGEGINKFVLSDARVFDEPITGVNGKLNIWGYDLASVPKSHKVDTNVVSIEGKELTLQLSNKIMDPLPDYVRINVTESLIPILSVADEEDENCLIEVDTIRIKQTDGTVRRFELPDGMRVEDICDDNGEPIKFWGLGEEDTIVQFIELTLGKEL